MRMDPVDWDELARDVVARLKPRIQAKWVPAIDSEIAGGEWAMAVEDLAGILADDQVPVTAADQADLLRLLVDLGDSTEDVDRLNVAEHSDHDA